MKTDSEYTKVFEATVKMIVRTTKKVECKDLVGCIIPSLWRTGMVPTEYLLKGFEMGVTKVKE